MVNMVPVFGYLNKVEDEGHIQDIRGQAMKGGLVKTNPWHFELIWE